MNTYISRVHCGSAFEPSGSGLPYYCTPPVCVPAVLDALAVWRLQTKTKQKVLVPKVNPPVTLKPKLIYQSIMYIPLYARHYCLVIFIVCLYICVCECLLQNKNHEIKHKNNTNCGSAFEPGVSGLPLYCTFICVRFGFTRLASCVDSTPKKITKTHSDVMELLAVWRHNKPKIKKKKTLSKGGGQKR